MHCSPRCNAKPGQPNQRPRQRIGLNSRCRGRFDLRALSFAKINCQEVSVAACYSHSIVPGGFEVTSYTTRFTPFTSFTILLEIAFSTSCGSGTQSAVIPSSECTARIAQVQA